MIYRNVQEYMATLNKKPMVVRLPSRKKGRPCKYPWHDTKVGQSFFLPNMLSCITHTTARDVVFRGFKYFNAYTPGMKAVPGSRWKMENQYTDGEPIGVLITRVV